MCEIFFTSQWLSYLGDISISVVAKNAYISLLKVNNSLIVQRQHQIATFAINETATYELTIFSLFRYMIELSKPLCTILLWFFYRIVI